MDNCGQGEGLVAYIRLWSWYNSNSHERKYEYRQQVLSPDRCKAVSGVADAIERWESRLASVQQADDSFSCSESWKIAIEENLTRVFRQGGCFKNLGVRR